MKIYCNDCQYLKLYPDAKQGIRYICKKANNKIVIEDNWFNAETYNRKMYPEEINTNNDCVWYKQLIEKKTEMK